MSTKKAGSVNKFVFVLPSPKRGGGNRVITEIANQLSKKGFMIDIICPMNSQDEWCLDVNSGINFIKIGRYSKNKMIKIINFVKSTYYINRQYNKKIIIFTDPLMSLLMCFVKNNNVFRFMQADDYKIFDDLMILKYNLLLYLYKIFIRNSYKYSVKYIFNSNYTYRQFINVSKHIDIPMKLVHPALNHEKFYNMNIRDASTLNICLVAREHPCKGFSDFITCFNLIKEHICGNIYILSNDNLACFDMPDKFQLIKPRDDAEMSLYLNKSHIFVSTSWSEGFGLPPLEAMACGCAVLTSDSGGVNEYAYRGLNCLTYTPKNIDEMAQQLIILIKDQQLREKLSTNALLTAREFSWQKSCEQFLEAIEDGYGLNIQ